MQDLNDSPDEFESSILSDDEPELSALWKSRISFDWHDLPSIDVGVSRKHPVDSVAQWKVQLSTGREVSLSVLHQDFTYEGLLAGLPDHPEYELQYSYKKALDLFPFVKTPPMVLPPTLIRGKRLRQEDGNDVLDDWTLLPRIRTIALFDSTAPAQDTTESNSSLIVLWFQHQMGLPVEESLISQIRNINWEKLACDWSH